MRRIQTRRVAAVVAAAGALSGALASVASAEEAATTAPAEPTAISQVVVTATRGQTRTVATSPAPIDVISRQALADTGKTTLKEALAVLLPSFNFGTVNGFAHNEVIRPVSLRGLSAAYTLVLINGKRRHQSALLLNSTLDSSGATPVDLDLIPISAVDRIEVLRDGAAAQYGSDAIAGVINVILKSSDHGGSISATAGQYYYGDDGRLELAADQGFKVGDDGALHLALDVKHQEHANPSRNGYATGAFYFPLPNGQPDPRESAQALGDYNGDPLLNQVTVSGDFQKPIGRDFSAYSFATYGYRNGNGFMTKRRPNATGDIPQIYPNGYVPDFILYENDFEAVAGVKGERAGWAIDLSTSYGADYTNSYGDTLNPSLGPTGPTRFYLYGLDNETSTSNVDVSRAFEVGLSRPLNLAFGVEFRNERYVVVPGSPDAYENGGYIYTSTPLAGQAALIGVQGVNVVDSSAAGSASRNNVATYVDVGLYPLPKWYVDLAGRDEYYDDSAGNNTSGKITTRYDVTDKFALRGTASTGFRAPSLSEELYGQRRYTTQIVGGVSQQFPSDVVPVNSALAAALGATPLKPETATNFSAGFTYEPLRNLYLTLDAYEIYIDNRIALTSTLSGAGVNTLLARAGLPQNIFVQYFTNAINTRTGGADLVSEYRVDLGDYGALKLGAAANYNKTDITHIRPNPAVLASLGSNLQLFDHVQQGSLTVGLPKSKVIVSADWTHGKLGVNLRLTRYGAVVQTSDTPGADRSFNAKTITDLEARYAFTPRLSFAVGADNILDVYPSKSAILGVNGNAEYYGTFSPFGIYGGYYYTRLSYAF